MTSICRFTLVLAFLAAASAELVQFQPCDDPDGSVQCDVQNVNINPCAEAESGEPCRIRKGNSAAITFDFTPSVSATELESKAYWVGSMGSLPWIGMETNACLFTTCPVTAGQVSHYNYTLKVSKKYTRVQDPMATLGRRRDDEMLFCYQNPPRLEMTSSPPCPTPDSVIALVYFRM
ncbi:hypothetical protein B566_EDAN014249 [Ephemera danica]|nr:hypothetical protein B566_EDAN014249 [Ephemera danica]